MILPRLSKTTPHLRGSIVADHKTKDLVKRIKPGQVAVVCHRDIDQMAAQGLIEAKVKAVINCEPSMTGAYPAVGTRLLMEQNIPVFDVIVSAPHIPLRDGMNVLIENQNVYIEDQGQKMYWATGKRLTWKFVEQKTEEARNNMQACLKSFIENTLDHARNEKDYFLEPLPEIPVRTRIRNRDVLVVVRGKHYKEDLYAIRSYIQDYRPVLIGVDGGADALMENGYVPDYIMGDMDSVSDEALQSAANVIVHAYPDGRAPGMKRIRELGIEASLLPFPGTSEDVAMLFAYEQGARWIVTLGAHSNMIDFLEKGRRGMASTVLVRMKIGTKLIDAKGVSMLYQKRVKWQNLFYLGIAAIFPVLAFSLVSPATRHMWQIIRLQFKILFS
ncbi:MAG: hypothetical protein H0Z33_00630 [Bacillaceae bacterium]|nr:hypothetical protein [Bacillaceae bacterium]